MTILCPFCWPHDSGELDTINDNQWYYYCTHCGNYMDKEQFIDAVKILVADHAIELHRLTQLIEK